MSVTTRKGVSYNDSDNTNCENNGDDDDVDDNDDGENNDDDNDNNKWYNSKLKKEGK